MPELGTSIAVASLIVGLLTIPAASKSLTSESPITAKLTNISSSDIPSQVETEISPESFSRSKDSAFKEFETSINSEEASSTLETPASRLTVSRSPYHTKSVLESSRGTLTVVESSESVNETLETPHGTLETVRENGGIEKNFEGSKREKVEGIAEEMRDAMEEKRKEVESRNQKAKAQRLAKSLELGVEEESPEHVVIHNTGRRAVSLDGWKLLNNNPDSHEFSGLTVEPGQTLKAYSKDKEDLNVTEQEEAEYVYGTGLTWENTGDTATLKTDKGYKVLKESY